MRKLLGRKTTDGDKAKKATRANLGDESSFYYDEKLKAWVDKKGGSGDGGSTGDDGGLPPPPTAPPIGAPPTSQQTGQNASSQGYGDGGDGPGSQPPSGPGSQQSANPLSRSSSMSHVRNRYVDVFGNTAPDGNGNEPDSNRSDSSSSNNTLLAPVLPGGVPGNDGASQMPAAPKFFMPVVPSSASMTSGTSQDGDTDGEASNNEPGLRIATDIADDAPTLLKGDSATTSPKKQHKVKPVDVLVEDESNLGGASASAAAATAPATATSFAPSPLGPEPSTGATAGSEQKALGQWAAALGREADSTLTRNRNGNFFIPGPSDDTGGAEFENAHGNDVSLLRSPGGGFASRGGASGGTGADDAHAILPRRSVGSNAGDARLSGNETTTPLTADGTSEFQASASLQTSETHIGSYAYQDGGAWTQTEDGNWYWYPADGSTPVMWTGDGSQGVLGTNDTTGATAETVIASLPDPPSGSYDLQSNTVVNAIPPPDASLVEDEVDYDAQWQAALDAAYAAANDAEVAQAKAEAEAAAARDALALREAEIDALRQAAIEARQVVSHESQRSSTEIVTQTTAEVETLRVQTQVLRVEVSEAVAEASAWEARARDAERRAEDAAAAAAERISALQSQQTERESTTSNSNRGDDGMPGGDAGDAAGDAVQSARAAGYRAGHADGTREGIAAATAENDEQMADLLVCLGEEDRKIEKLRELLEERGVDTLPVMAALEAENEAALRDLVNEETETNEDGKKSERENSEIGETSFASSVHFMADASAMPPVSPVGSVPFASGHRGPDTPSAGGARVLQDISLPDIPAFDEDKFDEDTGGNTMTVAKSGNYAAAPSTEVPRAAGSPFDEWNMSGEIARDGEAVTNFSPGGWDLNSPLVGGEGVSNVATCEVEHEPSSLAPVVSSVVVEDGARVESAPAQSFAAPIAETRGGPFGAADDDAEFFEHLKPAQAEQPQMQEYAQAAQLQEYAQTQHQYPDAQPHQYPPAQPLAPSQWSQPAPPAHQPQPVSGYYDPNTGAAGSHGGSQPSASQPASPAWNAPTQPTFFNPNAVQGTTSQQGTYALQPGQNQPQYQHWGGSSVEDRSAQWGYAQQQQQWQVQGGATGKY